MNNSVHIPIDYYILLQSHVAPSNHVISVYNVRFKSWQFVLNLCNCILSRAAKPRARAAPPGDPLLFEDTSSGVPPMNNQNYYESGYNIGAGVSGGQGTGGANNLFADPVASAAMMYGSSLANQGKEIVNKEVRCPV